MRKTALITGASAGIGYELSKLFGTDMVLRRSGSILNVASTAAFQAGPLMSSYYASKAYVLSLSEALNNEFGQDNLTVSVLCPGPTETEFADRAEMTSARFFFNIFTSYLKKLYSFGIGKIIKVLTILDFLVRSLIHLNFCGI